MNKVDVKAIRWNGNSECHVRSDGYSIAKFPRVAPAYWTLYTPDMRPIGRCSLDADAPQLVAWADGLIAKAAR